jgi:putative restriction endonuclease
MCARIEKYRRGQPPDPRRDYEIGCIMISQPIFFEESDWVREPAGFSRNIVSGKGTDVAQGEGKRILEECLERVRARGIQLASEPAQLVPDPDATRFGSPVLVTPRLGQGTFRLAVTDSYGCACAVTGEHSLPVLDVAHIQPYRQGGRHELKNGLLLRTDIHRLFDRGYVTITPDFRFE